MKIKNKRGIKFPTHIIVSALLLLVQFAFILYVVLSLDSNWIYYLSTVIGALTVIIIINRRGNPDHKITWIVFILIFPIFGISVFLLWGGGRLPPHLKKRMRTLETKYWHTLREESGVFDRLRYFDITHSRQADYLTRETSLPLYDKSSVEYFSSGEEFFPSLLSELRKAQKFIFIEFFILAEGEMWEEIHQILRKKVSEGVDVRIIFDDFGSIKRQRKGFISKLRTEGIKVCAFNPINPIMNIFMNNRDHRKIVVVDGKIAFTGGVNIGDEYINAEVRFGHWVDSAIMIKGNAVKSFTAMFCCMWEFVTRKPINIKKLITDIPEADDSFIIPYCDGPLNDKNPAEGIYMQILNTAQKYVYIATPYLIIDNTMKTQLQMAAKSGVDVRIVTPHIPDKWYVHPVTQYNYLELLECGVKIYEYTPGFVHSKLFVSDDMVATVGSVNMDYRSFVFHFECGAWFTNSKSVIEVRDHLKSLFDHSKEITLASWKKRPIWFRLKQAILHIFAPLM